MKTTILTLAAIALLMTHTACTTHAPKTTTDAPAVKRPPTVKEIAAMKKIAAPSWTVPGIDLQMKRIPKGSFIMGSPADEAHRRADEVEHTVTISKPFYMGTYEVTQEQFYRLMMPKDYDFEGWDYKRGPIADGAAYHYRKRPHGIIFRENSVGGPLLGQHPMDCLTWGRAREYCRKVTEIERTAGRLPQGYVYRLPTEAEWEYACRAGMKGPYNVAIDTTDIRSLKTIAFFGGSENWWHTRTSKVGDHRLPNAWGLYDMHGNVYEWCLDGYAPYAAKGPATDPIAPQAKERVVRGGCFYLTNDNAPIFMRSACRYALPTNIEFYAIVGMRMVLAPEIMPTAEAKASVPAEK
jgi:formylglycine-generating enzyme required for sulfatase activity